MARRVGIRVHLRDPEGTVEYSGATSAMVAPDGSMIVVRDRPRGFPEALDQIPRHRWRYWAPWGEQDPPTGDS